MCKLFLNAMLLLLISLSSFAQQKLDIYIVAGQSNVSGRGLVSDLSQEQKPQNAKFFGSWHKFTNNASAADINPQLFSGWRSQTIAGETRNDGNISETFGGSAWFGPEVGFAARANEINLSPNPMAIIKYAVDGSAINNTVNPQLAGSTSDWDTVASGEYAGDCWRGFKLALANAVAELQNDGYTANFKGMIWWQGESGTNAAALNTFIGEVRSHLATNYGVQNANDFPVVITGSFAWGANLKTAVADQDDDIGYIDPNDFGQGGWSNIHLGSGENGQPLDIDGNGINDMFDIGMAYADEMATIVENDGGGADPDLAYEITFINVDGSQTIQSVEEGGVAVPPTGVNTVSKTFTTWPTINAAYADATYTALYTNNDPGNSNASVTVSLSQSTNAGIAVTNVDLSEHGNLDWAAWNGGGSSPIVTMEGGSGFSAFTAIGATTFGSGSFYGQNNYTWTNGSPSVSGSSSLAGSSNVSANGDGVSLSINIASAGTYQLKFYTTTYDLNFDATASLSSGAVVGEANGTYVSNSVQKYEYTIDFTTEGADTLTFDMVKNGGASYINAQEAFSLKLVSSTPISDPAYDITFINVDGSQTVQNVSEGVVATPPAGVSTTDRSFTAWPTIEPAYENAVYEALYESVSTGGNVVDVFIATGQSNAAYPLYDGQENRFGFGRGIQAALTESGLFSNPTVVLAGEPSRPIAYWWAEFWPGAYTGYDSNFFDINNSGEGQLEDKINEIIANGDTPRFRGLFWFQGESDGLGSYATADTSQADYETRWDGLLAQLDADLQAAGLSNTEYKFVVNTVAESGDKINTILNYIANQGNHSDKGVIYDAVNSPYHDQDVIVEANYGNLHDYDHVMVGRANAQLFINTFVNDQGPVENYNITFINVDGTQTTQAVDEGEIAVPPTGVNTVDKSFTSWPTILPANGDQTYSALYELVDPRDFLASADISLSQSAHGTPGSTLINLSDHGNLDWAAWNGGAATPNVAMVDGFGFASFSAIGNTMFNSGSFYGQNLYDWTNGFPTLSGSSSLAGSASLNSNGDGVRLTVNVGAAGTYQLKFYTTTYDLNLDATASLVSGTVVAQFDGSHVANSVEKYEYTVDFTTEGPDTLNLDMVKNGGGSYIFAQEAFSLKAINVAPPTGSTYDITFINVDGSQTVQSVNEGSVATAPEGISTVDKTFTAWPTVEPAYENVTYLALYENVVTGGGNIVDVFIATGQSNAYWPIDSNSTTYAGLYGFGNGVQEALSNSGLFSNPTVIIDGEPGQQISQWHDGVNPQWIYQKQFFGTYQNSTAKLQAKLNQIIAEGNIPRFRGLFWFQGESDGAGTPPYQNNTSENDYNNRWSGLLSQLESDLVNIGISSDDYKFVMNTVGNSGAAINATLTNITNSDSRGVLFDTQVEPYRINTSDIHGYDHNAVGQANVDLFISTFIDPPSNGNTYTITFINVDGSQTSLNVDEGLIATPPTGIDTAYKTFTGWPNITAASADVTYTALFSLNDTGDLNSSANILLSQSSHGSPSSTNVDLSAHGNLDWAAWNGGPATPNTVMVDGGGFASFSAIGNTTFNSGSFYGQNLYSWTNGSPTLSGSSSFAGSASLNTNGDGVRLSVNVQAAGSYQLKFYTTTYDLNLDATASLVSGTVVAQFDGNYVANSVEKYEYTVDFTTEGPDTLNLDMVKSGGNSFIFAQEAFSLKAVNVAPPTESTYDITFVNVDGSQTVQTVNEGELAVPPTGVNTEDRTFVSWPTILEATDNASYYASFESNDPADLTEVDVYIIAGQSNAYGQGLTSDLNIDQQIQDALFFTSWHETDGNAESQQYFSNVLPFTEAGISKGNPGQSNLGGSEHFGPELGFVDRINELGVHTNPVAIIKYAVGGTSLTYNPAVSDWDLNETGYQDGDCWRGFQAALSNGVASLEAKNYVPNIKGVIWWQGESGTSATDLNAFIAEVRSHLSINYGVENSAQLPFVITGTDNVWGSDLEDGVAALDDYVGFVNSQDFGQASFDGVFNSHLGSGERGISSDVDDDGINDMFEIGGAYADQFQLINNPSLPIYTLNYLANSGGSIGSVISELINQGDDSSLITAIANEGYNFVNWIDSTNNIVTTSADLHINNVSASETYTANFVQKQYTVTFDLGIASLESGELVQTVTHGDSAQAPEIIVPLSHTFTSWSADFSNITEDLSVVAQFTLKSYSVTFDLGDGSRIGGGSLSQTIDHGNAASSPTLSAPIGFVFTNWDTNFDSITTDLVVTAQYTESITQDIGENGSVSVLVGENNEQTYTVIPSEGYLINSLIINGEVIDLSSSDRSSYEHLVTEVGEDDSIEVTFIDESLVYTVTFELNGGTYESGLLNQSIVSGDSAFAPVITAPQFYNFTNWDTDFDEVNNDLTIKAVYALKQYTVTFDLGIASLESGELSQNISHGSGAQAPAMITPVSHAFTSWSADFSNITGELAVKAQFAIKNYNVSFDLGVGSRIGGGTLNQSVSHGASAVAPDIAVPEAYQFTGWSADFSNITGNLTVEAQYALKVYSVNFDLGAGSRISGGSLSQNVSHGSSAQAPNVVAPEGEYFKSWDSDFNNITNDLTVKAIYASIEGAEFTIRFDVGEEGISSGKNLVQTVAYAEMPKIPKVKAAYGYEFLAWDSEIVGANSSKTYVARYQDLSESVRNLDLYTIDKEGAKIYDLNASLQQIHESIRIDASGKIIGVYEDVAVNSYRVGSFKGKLKSGRSGLGIKLSNKEKNTIDRVDGKQSFRMTLSLQDNQLIGEKKVYKQISPVAYPLIDTDGTYALDLSTLKMDTKGKYLGNVNLILSNGKRFTLSAKGKYSVKTSKAKISLKGIKGQASYGIKFKLTINSENEIEQIKAKALGQKLSYIK